MKGFNMLRRFPPVLAVLIFALATVYWLFQPAPFSPVADFDLPFSANAEGSDASGTENSDPVISDMFLGPEDAPITVIEYASFTCPHCATFHKDVYKSLKKKYIDTNKIKFVFREVYFDKYGMWASLVARCAGKDKFFGLADMIMKTQNKWARAENDLQWNQYSSSFGFFGRTPGDFRFEREYVAVKESAGRVTCTVVRVGGSAGTVGCSYATREKSAKAGSDFVHSEGVLTFGPGVTRKEVTIEVIDDAEFEKDETFQLVLTEATGGVGEIQGRYRGDIREI